MNWPGKSLDIELIEMRMLIERESRPAAAVESIAHEALESAENDSLNQTSAAA